jgi:hypothetical protein
MFPPVVCWVNETKKAADLLETDGLFETAYDEISCYLGMITSS